MTAANLRATVIPSFRYRDAPAAIDWLCQAFGFERHLVVPAEPGRIAHAQLIFGSGMIMIGSSQNDSEHNPANDSADRGTYVVVEDVDAHCARARAAGATIVLDPENQDHGGRLYACRDPEGIVWHFGSYDPWKDG